MSEINYQLEELYDDAAYLLEEIDALEKIIEVVPYNEKPFGQESVLEMLGKITCAESNIFVPSFKQIVNGSYKMPDNFDREIDNHCHSQFFDETDPHEVFISLKESRKTTLELLKSLMKMLHNEKVDSENRNSRRGVLVYVMRKMIDFDRLQLKNAAEKVLSIEIGKK